jgi:hypothetical protein
MTDGLDEFPFDWIATDLREGNCIPFLGAGASAFPKDVNAKPPSARALALELARESRYPHIKSPARRPAPMTPQRRSGSCAPGSTAKI